MTCFDMWGEATMRKERQRVREEAERGRKRGLSLQRCPGFIDEASVLDVHLKASEDENIAVNAKLKENVMPLELAIKRELDYRLKMEGLHGIRADKKEALVSFHGPSQAPGPSVVGKKRKAMSSNLRFFSTQQPRTCKLICTLCQIGFSSKSALRQHRQESIHKTKVLESQKKLRAGKNKPQWCELCQISCSDERAFTQHLAGKKHAASVHAIEAAKSIRNESDKKVLKVNWDELEWDMVS